MLLMRAGSNLDVQLLVVFNLFENMGRCKSTSWPFTKGESLSIVKFQTLMEPSVEQALTLKVN